MNSLNRPLAVTMGDPAGIGPDVILACWAARRSVAVPEFVVYGEAEVLRDRARDLGVGVKTAAIENLTEVETAFEDALPVAAPRSRTSGVRRDNASAVATFVEEATAAVASGAALALVTGPAVKSSFRGLGLPYPGHTAFLGQLASKHWSGREFRPTMMLVSDELKVVPATVHVPLASVAASLSVELLVQTLRITERALIDDFGVSSPRIAVAGLNPHAGEGGLIGSEEKDTIVPAIAVLAAGGANITGPHSADTLFHADARATYDAVVAMYHDQALIPFKTLCFDRGVNTTLGLPFVRTSPDHGTAFMLAGTGKARPDSFIAALRLAAELGRRRAVSHASVSR